MMRTIPYPDDGTFEIALFDMDPELGRLMVVVRRTDDMHYRAKSGVPSDQCEFLTVSRDTTDETIVTLVRAYVRGHAQGWSDGQWQLRHDFKKLMHIRQD